MKKEPRLINVGCGGVYHKDWINLDFVPASSDVTACNILEGLPFPNASADAIYHSHVLEHLPRQEGTEFIRECARVLKPGGIIRIVIPDLEQLARNYLTTLEDCEREPRSTYRAELHCWSTIQLIDQCVRESSGGEMVEFLNRCSPDALARAAQTSSTAKSHQNDLDQPKDAHLNGNGSAGNRPTSLRLRNLRQKVRRVRKAFEGVESEAERIGALRLSGEVHKWMYDRISMKLLLENSSFENVSVCCHDESAIESFSSYGLDTDRCGNARKPDSLFVEAIKCSAS